VHASVTARLALAATVGRHALVGTVQGIASWAVAIASSLIPSGEANVSARVQVEASGRVIQNPWLHYDEARARRWAGLPELPRKPSTDSAAPQTGGCSRSHGARPTEARPQHAALGPAATRLAATHGQEPTAGTDVKHDHLQIVPTISLDPLLTAASLVMVDRAGGRLDGGSTLPSHQVA
jgi:hypothetical protein